MLSHIIFSDYSILNKYFDHIYVPYINDKEMYNSQSLLKQHNVTAQYFKGINGKLKDKEYALFTNKTNIPTLGCYGNLLTFIQLMQDAIKNNYNSILILEPDIYFCTEFANKLEQYTDLLTNDYKILFLGASQHVWKNIYIIDNRYYHPHLTCGAFAWSLKRSVFEEYLQLLETMTKPTDIITFNLFKKYTEKCYVIYPSLICCNVTNSNTNNKRNQKELTNKFKWNLKYDYTNYFTIKNIKNGWNRIDIKLNENRGYKKGSIKILNTKGTKIFPTVKIPNVLFSSNNKKITCVEELNDLQLFSLYVHIPQNTINIVSTDVFIGNISCIFVENMNIDIYRLRRLFDCTFIDYYLNWFDMDEQFLQRYYAQKAFWKNHNYLDKIITKKNYQSTNKTPKVLYLTSKDIMDAQIGYTIRTLNLVKYAGKSGADIIVVSPENKNREEQIDYYHDTVHYIKLKDININNTDIITFYIKYIEKVVELCIKYDINIVHASSDYHNGIVAYYVGKILNIYSVYEVRGLWGESSITFRPELYKSDLLKLREKMELFVCKNVNKLLTINENLKDQILLMGIERDIDIVPNGIDITKFANINYELVKLLRKKYSLETKIVIGYIGSILEYEGLDYMIEVMKQLENIVFFVAGAGDDKLCLKLKNAKNVIYVGKINYDDVTSYYKLFDFVSYPRKNYLVCRTTNSSKIYEPMAMGIPVITSDLPPCRTIIKNEETGILFESDNIHELLKAIHKLANDNELRTRLGDNAKKWCMNNRDFSMIGKSLSSIYKNL